MFRVALSFALPILFLPLLCVAQIGGVEAQVAALLPPGAVYSTVIGYTEPAAWTVAGATAEQFRLEADAGLPAANARRIRVAAATNPRWNAALRSQNSTGAVRRNDVVLLSFWMRQAGENRDAQAVAWVGVELPRAPFTGFLGQSVGASAEWTQIFAAGRANADFPAGDLRVIFHLGLQQQTIEVAGLTVINLGQQADIAKLPFTKITYTGRAADAPWREEAQRRIERYRMADLRVKVVDAAGNAVPGAKVNVTMTKRQFGVGSFLESFTARRTPEEQQQELALFKRLFNRGTSPIYWADWGWPSRRPAYLATAKWLADNGITTRGHTMLYPTWQFMPAAVRPLASNPDALRARMLEQVREISEATREFGFREYDVTNELRDLTEVVGIVGRDAIVNWFAEARALLPGAKMTLNENTILTQAGATGFNQENLLGWYRFLDSQGQAPDVLGLQGHMGPALTAPEDLWRILDRFQRETRAEIQITEFDLDTRDEQTQAEYTRDFFTACFAHPAVTGITMWGFWGEMMYVPNGAFFRKDFSPKPNGVMLEELLTKTWWTRLEGESGDEGAWAGKVFLGTLDVTVTSGEQTVKETVTLEEAGGERTITIQLQ
jgi:endo-1,4-beta-xylanase